MPINVEEARLAAAYLEGAGWTVAKIVVSPKSETNLSHVEITCRPPSGRARTIRADARYIQDAAREAATRDVRENE